MASNYDFPETAEEVRVNANERPCARCRGLGTVLVHGQEADCIDCEGFGSILI